MFDRFSHRARLCLVFAQEEAKYLDHDWVGTEHLLLGLIRVRDGVAAHALEALGVSLGSVRGRVEAMIGRGPSPVSGALRLTPRTKKVLELSLREALRLGHNYVGTEHILLSIIREGDGVAARVLDQMGVTFSEAQANIMRLLAAGPHSEAGPGADAPSRTFSDVVEGIAAVFDENARLRAEVDRLRQTLSEHGIDPDIGQTRPA